MRKLRWYGTPFVAALALLAIVSYALAGNDGGKTHFKSDMLIGYQEVVGPGPISTVGTGTFEADLRDNELAYTLTYTGLEGGSVLFAHIHFGQRSVGGGVIAFLCGGGSKPACPASPATVSGTITPADIVGPNGQGIEPGSFDEAVRALRAGAVYANVHTTRWPAGEIRGQVNDSNQRDDEGR
jgi:hypothetical protein